MKQSAVGRPSPRFLDQKLEIICIIFGCWPTPFCSRPTSFRKKQLNQNIIISTNLSNLDHLKEKWRKLLFR